MARAVAPSPALPHEEGREFLAFPLRRGSCPRIRARFAAPASCFAASLFTHSGSNGRFLRMGYMRLYPSAESTSVTVYSLGP